MILLPDIILNIYGAENRLSLQDPYTLNGKLITNISISCDPENYYDADFRGQRVNTIRSSMHCFIQIRNEEDYNIVVSYENLSRMFHSKLNDFFSEQHRDEVLVDENRYAWTISRRYGISNYLRDLGGQCYQIYNRNYNAVGTSFVSRCKERLRNQGRLQEERNSRTETRYVRCYGTAIPSDRVCVVQPTVEQKKKYIHSYNYKPEYIKHYMPDENESTLLLGAEIEVDCGGESEEHAKKVLEIMCGINPDNTEEALENKMYCTHDGSLRNGIEFDTMPCTLEYHKNKMKYQEMFEYLDKNGYKAHDTNTCGLHIHANRTYLGKSELVQQLTISKILYILEKFNDEICVIARRNSYSKFVGKEEVNKSLDKLYSKYNSDKHVALNLKHKETIEFRCFKGTLKYETFILTLEFVKDIIDYAKSVNIEEIELIKWSDLMNTFSDELKEYYNDRLEKESKKKEEKSSISIGSGTLYFRDDSGEGAAVGSFASFDTITTTINDEYVSSYYPTTEIRRLSNDSSASISCTLDSSSIASLNNILYGRNENTNISSRVDELETRIENVSEIEKKKKRN